MAECVYIRLEDGNTATARVSEGSEAADTPRESYVDASDETHPCSESLIHGGLACSRHHSRESHATGFLRGDIKIWYTVTVHHGLLVGDGNVNADHIDSDTATDGQVLTADGSSGATWELGIATV